MSRSASPVPQLPRCLNGLFNFDDKCTLVTDADEEILELYMDLANTSPDTHTLPSDHGHGTNSGGLGFLDSSKATLELSWDLVPTAALGSHFKPTSDVHATSPPVADTRNGTGSRRRRSVKQTQEQSNHIEVKLQQDLQMLKASKGDTGSVLWRSSYYLAEHLLSQLQFPPTPPSVPLLNPTFLSNARILELGSGTGLLAILLRCLCAQYTASDRWENLKLIKRNLQINKVGSTLTGSSPKAVKEKIKHQPARIKPSDKGDGGEVVLEEIDWVAVSNDRRRRTRSPPATDPSQAESQYDLVLCVDCIFNEHLIQPLVDTLVKYCPRGGETVVWIVAELRSSDVMTKFLETWLGDSSGPWTVVRLSPDGMGRWEGRKPRWVGWVGWR